MKLGVIALDIIYNDIKNSKILKFIINQILIMTLITLKILNLKMYVTDIRVKILMLFMMLMFQYQKIKL